MPLGRGRNKNRKEIILCMRNAESVHFILSKTEIGFALVKIQNTVVSTPTITINARSLKNDE